MRTDTWCLKATRRSWLGRTYDAYYSRDQYVTYTWHRGSAVRYASKAEAVREGRQLKRSHRWVAFTVEYIPADVHAAGIAGTGGRA